MLCDFSFFIWKRKLARQFSLLVYKLRAMQHSKIFHWRIFPMTLTCILVSITAPLMNSIAAFLPCVTSNLFRCHNLFTWPFRFWNTDALRFLIYAGNCPWEFMFAFQCFEETWICTVLVLVFMCHGPARWNLMLSTGEASITLMKWAVCFCTIFSFPYVCLKQDLTQFLYYFCVIGFSASPSSLDKN